jgi:hypothetical protein
VYWTSMTRRTLLTALAVLGGFTGSPLLACNRDRIALTCDATLIKPASYGLTTRGVALASAAQYDFWEQFDVDSPGRPMTSPDEAMAFAAQRAAEVDITNQMAHAIGARELLLLGQTEMAEAAWHRVLENQGSVVWIGTLSAGGGPDEFLVEFDRQDMRIYSRAQVQERSSSSSSDEALWAALGGCVDSNIKAAAIVLWLNVREIKEEKKGVLSFRLNEPISITIAGKGKQLDRVDVGLRGLSGDRSRGVAPARPDAVRRMLAKLVDPERRIALPISN